MPSQHATSEVMAALEMRVTIVSVCMMALPNPRLKTDVENARSRLAFFSTA